jgi:hypothetical protein
MISAVIITSTSDRINLPVLFATIPEDYEIVLVETIQGAFTEREKIGEDQIYGRNIIYGKYTYAPGHFSFSHARNFAKSLASGEWILSLDTDEILFLDIKAIEQLPKEVGGVYCQVSSFIPDHEDKAAHWENSVQCRIFRNDPAIEWQFRAHEQITPSIINAGYNLIHANIVIRHDGYSQHDYEIITSKMERNLSLMFQDLAENPKIDYLRNKVRQSLNWLEAH